MAGKVSNSSANLLVLNIIVCPLFFRGYFVYKFFSYFFCIDLCTPISNEFNDIKIIFNLLNNIVLIAES